jgi:ubiquinone/menaquinone biosynthesis C-methylase UbiE
VSDTGFIPALRFHRLTPLFDYVAAATVRDRAIKRRVLDRAAIGAGERVLDVGCGTGTLAVEAARSAPGVRVTGLDADPTILARARRRVDAAGLDVRIDEGWSNALPYEPASFDVVLSTLFFHHLEDHAKQETAAEAMRVLRPGGRWWATWGGRGTRSCASRRAPRLSCSTASRPPRSTSAASCPASSPAPASPR